MQLLLSSTAVAAACCYLAVAGAEKPSLAASSSPGDKIVDLPGAPKDLGFDMYSGYVKLGSEDRYLFYWFVESQNDPAKDPVVLWTNGGPGCSGLGGFMTEQGPFRPTANGTLTENPAAWNQIANVIFIEQPAGVGFSYSDSPVPQFNDSQAAQDNHLFVKGWFDKFPQYKAHDFFLTSESYGGHYLPTLAKSLVDGNDVPNFKGFMVGNPLTYMQYRNYGQFATFAGHQMIPRPMWQEYLDNDCRYQVTNVSDTCNDLMNTFMDLTQLVDPYALDFPICTSDELSAGRNERHALLSIMARSEAGAHLKQYFPTDYEPCDADWGAAYLNQADVQTAIHVHGQVKWADCSDAVNQNYNQEDTIKPMMPIYEYLFEKRPDLRIMVYSGDDDSICSTSGSQEWIWGVGGNQGNWTPWTMDGQLAGYTVKFDHFRFTTIHGAGHMCPATRPAQTLEAFKLYLTGGDWTSN